MQNAAETPVFPEGNRYTVILADPPWAWSKTSFVNRGKARTVEKEYQTMQPAEIMALPIAELAEPQAALFLWATSPKLPLALAVMSAWGFEYKTVAFVWVKRNRLRPTWFQGMGFYTRQNAEFVLLGTRGSPALPRKDKGVHQVVDTPINIHSRKPDTVRQRIDQLFSGRKIELFARERVPGWDAWGLEVPIIPAA